MIENEENEKFLQQRNSYDQGRAKKTHLVLSKFFDSVSFIECREAFEDLLYCALINDNDIFDKRTPRSNINFLLMQIEELIEAAYLLHFRKYPKEKAQENTTDSSNSSNQ